MKHISSIPVGLLAGALTIGATSAAADPVTIAAGSFLELNSRLSGSSANVLHLEGTSRGFTLNAVGMDMTTSDDFFLFCSGSPPGTGACDPGQRISLGQGWTTPELGAQTITLDGLTFPVDEDGYQFRGGALVDFQSSFIVPSFAGTERVTITAPFTFSGVAFPPILARPTHETAQLVGRGTVRADLRWGPSREGPSSWTADRALYTFEAPAAVPEPATLLLVGSGITACVIRRRKRTGS